MITTYILHNNVCLLPFIIIYNYLAYTGFNLDCSVLFINMGQDDLFLFGQGSVLIEWEHVGPVESTDCRLETRVEGGDDIIGPYTLCELN